MQGAKNKIALLGLCLSLLLQLAALPPSQAAKSQPKRLFEVEDVVDCAALNQPMGGFSQLADIEVRDTSGKQRHMRVRIQGERDKESLLLNLRLLSPGNMAGTAALIRERSRKPDDIRLYLPELQRTRYISDALSGTRLFDTDFSYADLKQLYGLYIEGRIEYQGIEKWSGRNVHLLAIQPLETGIKPYDSLITRIDTETCVILGMDFLNVEQRPLRQLRADPGSISAIGSYHLASRYTMKDLVYGSQTSITLKDIRLHQKLPAASFQPETFFRDGPVSEPEPEIPAAPE